MSTPDEVDEVDEPLELGLVAPLAPYRDTDDPQDDGGEAPDEDT